jgi:3-oxoacyl-[acyl-carrier-protein] synthase III
MNLFITNPPLFIHGPCNYLPEHIVSNQDILDLTNSTHPLAMVGFSTGISQRHWAQDDQACSDLAIMAANNLFDINPLLKDKIRQLILATISGDYPSPPTSPLVLHHLGLKHAGAFDLGAACAGFVTALHTASALANASHSHILLIASEIRSKFLNHDDFATSVLFGDGACACTVSQEKSKANFKLIGSATLADGEILDTISIPAGGSRLPHARAKKPEDFYISVKDNATLFVKAVNGMATIAQNFMNELALTSADIDWLVPHQGNRHLVYSVARQLGISDEKTAKTVATTGNTSGASNGIALGQLLQEGKFKEGDKILLTAAGGGGMSACALLEAL